jgi:hypothetical protein
MNDDCDRYAIVDRTRSASLNNQGSGYLAATVVAVDGTEYLMLLRPHDIGNTVVYDCACSTVHHEQLGELPSDVASRIEIGRADG